MTEHVVPGRKIKVFVHLAYGFGRSAWKEMWRAGKLLGINGEDPYGYRQAEQMGCVVEQSEDQSENLIRRLLRLGLRACLGFDFLHAWRNRRGILTAEVVWTHTESQALAVLALMRFSRTVPKPKLIAQTIWMADDWKAHSAIRRRAYSFLLQSADVLTVHSSLALQELRRLFPDRRSELVLYGVRSDQSLERGERPMHQPTRVLTLGNDRHRDWTTFVQAFGSEISVEAKIVTRANLTRLIASHANISLERPSTNPELISCFEWADVVVLCLSENLHASGITVVQEAVLFGLPVICSDAGGLQSYFTAEEITYVEPHSAEALRQAVKQASANQRLSRSKALRALARMKQGNVNSWSFVERHVEISKSLLG